MQGTQPSPFGQQLRFWRKQFGLSQLDLACRAQTTPRHLSFIETGRSRPKRDLVLRLATTLELPIREQNALLVAAGLRPAYSERALDDAELRPLRAAVRTILDRHEPFPACAIDGLGQLRMTNATCRAFMPGAEELSPEEQIEHFFGPGPSRDALENWDEVAWAAFDRMRSDAARTQNSRLSALVERALYHLGGVPRPAPSNASPVMCMRMRMGGETIRMFSTVMRFDSAREITMSELRVELIFPMDDVADAFFRSLVPSP